MLAPQVDSLAQTPCHAEPLPGDAEGSSQELRGRRGQVPHEVACRRGRRAPSHTGEDATYAELLFFLST